MIGKTLLNTSILAMLLLGACTRDTNDPKNPNTPWNEEEIITSVQINFTDSAGIKSSRSFRFSDPDGEGGNAAIQFDTIVLDTQTTWRVEILLLNESANPVDTISEEIAKEKNDHQFFFAPQNADVTIVYLDKDDNQLPVGLLTKWTTGNASEGSIRIILKHQPDSKNNSQDHGESDIDLHFQVQIR